LHKVSTIFCRVVLNCKGHQNQVGWHNDHSEKNKTASFQQPPMPRSWRSGINVFYLLILSRQLFNDIRGAIRGMIIHDNNIKVEICFCTNAL